MTRSGRLVRSALVTAPWAFGALFLLCGASPSVAQTPAAQEVPVGQMTDATSLTQGRNDLAEVVLGGPVDPTTYVLGPGDVLEVVILGEVQERITEVVGPDGRLVVMPAGVVEVAGLSLSVAIQRIVDRLSPFYPGSEVTVHLRDLRHFEVRVFGEIEGHGQYVVTPVTRVSDLLERAGPSVQLQAPRGSRRAVILERRGEDPRSLDLEGAVRGWFGKEDPLLLDGDRLIVPPLAAQVQMSGAVHVPGAYEFLSGDTLEDLIRLAGGTTHLAAGNVLVQRGFHAEASRYSVLLEDASTETVQARDRVHVVLSRDLGKDERVTVEGAVVLPGAYPFVEGDRVGDLLALAGGWSEDAVPAEAYLLRAGDRFGRDAQMIRISAIPDSLRSHDEWEYLIQSSIDRAIYIDLAHLTEDESNAELVAGDVLRIPSRDDLVYVSGSVMRPGGHIWMPGAEYRDYLDAAHGVTDRGDSGKARLLRGSTGGWVNVHNDMEIRPGDTIWIPGKKRRDYWKLFQEVLQVVGVSATTYLVIDQIQSEN